MGGATEVKEQANFEAGGAEVVVELSLGIAMQVLGGLDLDDDRVVDHHIESLMRDVRAGVLHEHVQLTSDAVSSTD
jgi:hypothetical protein